MTTGWVTDERLFWQAPGPAAAFVPAGGMVEPDVHVEWPAPKRRFRNLVEASGLLARLRAIPCRPATRAELARFHTEAYLDRVAALSAAGGGETGELAPVAQGGYEVAALAAGGCLRAVEAVLGGEVDNAYALVRPPGHHAEPDRGRGSCIFSNVVLAALHARACFGARRLAIVDWDVHHGNAAQDAFWEDPHALTISIHQEEYFPPASGRADEVGGGAGEGANVNVPLPPGSGEGAYLAVLERVVAPALRAHRPDIVLVACGFDAAAIDPMGRMLLHSEAYRRMTRTVMDAARDVCDGRLVLCHEGGYSAAYAPFCGLAVVEELAGAPERVEDPFLETFAGMAGQELQPHQESVVARAQAAVGL